MAIILPTSNLFFPQTWTLQEKFDLESLPEVSEDQKKRADRLNNESMPVIGKSNRYYGPIKLEKIFAKLKEISPDLEISGKTAYYIGGKELSLQTAKKLKLASLPYSQEIVRDVDIRVFVNKLDQYYPFIDFLHSLFPRIDKSVIINDLLLASHTDKESISFTFGDKNTLSCDILFVLNPSRLHLFYRDAFRYSIKDNKFVSDLKNPLQALSDYYLNVVQTDNPEAINKKGWPKLLVAKAKGAHIPDASLEAVLFENVINSEKRKALVPEVIDLLTKAGKKASISFEDLLYEASSVLEKKLSPEDFRAVYSKATGKAARAVAANIPFHVIHSYLQLIGQKKGDPDLDSLFKTPFKRELDKIFDQTPIEEKLAPALFQQANPRAAWNGIKSNAIAQSFFQLMLDNDPVLANEAMVEFSLPYKKLVFQALLKKGHISEADSLYDEINDNAFLEVLTLNILKQDPSKRNFESYLRRSNGVISQAIAEAAIQTLPLPDLIDLSPSILPINPEKLIERLGPYLENLRIETLLTCTEEIKNEGIKRLVKKQIENPVPKEWRKFIEYTADEQIEPWFKAIIEKVSINEARLFCLHPRVSRHHRHADMVKAVAKEATLVQKSLYWDILDLCLTYNPKEAVRLIILSHGNTSGLPKTVLKKISDRRDGLLIAADNAFTLAECLNDLNIEPTSLAEKVVSLQFDSLSLLKGGWLGKEPFDLQTSRYFVEHTKFEAFYPLVSSQLHPLSPIQECICKLIEEKRYAFAASLTTNAFGLTILTKLRGLQIKERIDLLKKHGNETEWLIYLDEPNKKPEELYSYLLAGSFSCKIKNICLCKSSSAWEYFLCHPDDYRSSETNQAFQILFKRGLEANKSYALLQKLKEKLGPVEPSLETAWEARQFIEEPYNLGMALKQTPTPQIVDLLIAKIYKACPPKEDYTRLEVWLKDASNEHVLEIQLYFDPAKTMRDILLIKPNMRVFERLFNRLIEMKEFKHLKHVYTQFNREFRDKHRRAFLMNAIHDQDSQEFAVSEFHNMPPNDREFELDFITNLFGKNSPLDSSDWDHFYSIWVKISAAVTEHSKARCALIPTSKFDWENEEELLKGLVSLENQRPIRKLVQQDLKAKRHEAAHVCKTALIGVIKTQERKFKQESAQDEIFTQLMKLVPYHNIMTGDLDDAIFDFASSVPPALESVQHKERCKKLISCMRDSSYHIHYPASIITLCTLIEGTSSSGIELNKITEKLLKMSQQGLHNPKSIDVNEFTASEIEFNLHVSAIFKAHKKLVEYDTFHTHIRAWLIISNIQISLIKLNKIDWILKFYQIALSKLPKYAFCEMRENFYLIALIKGLIADLLRIGEQFKDYPISYRLLPEYIDTLFKTLEVCPEQTKQSFIADIMSLTLQYSNVNIKLIFDRLIDYVEKIIELTFKHAAIMQIEMFTQGISEPLTEYVKAPNINEMEKERLINCMRKLKNALKAQSCFLSLQNLMLQWSFHEKTLNIIKPQV